MLLYLNSNFNPEVSDLLWGVEVESSVGAGLCQGWRSLGVLSPAPNPPGTPNEERQTRSAHAEYSYFQP
jgi:hypothetical protein